MITNSVSQDVYMGLVYSENVVVWKELENTYGKVDGSIIFNLLQNINNVKQSGSSAVCDVKCSCDASKELSLHQQLIEQMQFLMGLDDCYQPVRSALLTSDPLPEVKDAYTTVSREESHGGIPDTSSANELKMNDTSFAAKSQSSTSVSSPGFTSEHMSKLLSLINDNTTVSVHANMAGANQHLTVSTARMFDVVDITSLKITAGHPNETLATICKMYVGFDEDKCYIQDLKKEKVLRIGSESGGLYLFDMDKVNFVGKSNMVPCFSVSKLLSHNRLGHPSDKVLSVLQSDLNITKNYYVPVCEVCHRAIQTRDTFPLSDHKSKGLGELIHLDLWGPYRVDNRE
ncbi:ribonuclease H-like domain-containing protein [Tanacetum coccineum]